MGSAGCFARRTCGFAPALPKQDVLSKGTGAAYSRATTVAMPMPPPTHKVAKPKERSRRAIS